MYYKCLRGDCENLGLTEPDSFVVEDARGRNWICHPVSEEDAEQRNLLDHLADTKAADAALSKHGLSRRGTEIRVYSARTKASWKRSWAKADLQLLKLTACACRQCAWRRRQGSSCCGRWRPGAGGRLKSGGHAGVGGCPALAIQTSRSVGGVGKGGETVPGSASATNEPRERRR